jgi:hypothetical protein
MKLYHFIIKLIENDSENFPVLFISRFLVLKALIILVINFSKQFNKNVHKQV